jgi:hypothetical protein
MVGVTEGCEIQAGAGEEPPGDRVRPCGGPSASRPARGRARRDQRHGRPCRRDQHGDPQRAPFFRPAVMGPVLLAQEVLCRTPAVHPALGDAPAHGR